MLTLFQVSCINVITFVIFHFQACENGRGAILLSVARGKVSEGIDFGGYFLLISKFLKKTMKYKLLLISFSS